MPHAGTNFYLCVALEVKALKSVVVTLPSMIQDLAFYTPVVRRDVLFYGVVRASVCQTTLPRTDGERHNIIRPVLCYDVVRLSVVIGFFFFFILL